MIHGGFDMHFTLLAWWRGGFDFVMIYGLGRWNWNVADKLACVLTNAFASKKKGIVVAWKYKLANCSLASTEERTS